MIPCKICEKDVDCVNLSKHSTICKEVWKTKEKIFQKCLNMEKLAEEANQMKINLEVSAAKQK